MSRCWQYFSYMYPTMLLLDSIGSAMFPFLEFLSFYMFVLLNFWFSVSENGTSALAESSSSLPTLKVS